MDVSFLYGKMISKASCLETCFPKYGLCLSQCLEVNIPNFKIPLFLSLLITSRLEDLRTNAQRFPQTPKIVASTATLSLI